MKENKHPILSICIPTYNREKYLKRLIDSIVSQKEFIDTDGVEIVISDNVSDDGTKQLIKNYIKIYGNKIKYHCNPVNIGLCPNLLKALSLGNGEYLWLFGSDDFMAPNALGNILYCINNIHPRLILSRRKEVHFGDKILEENKKCEISSFSGMTEFSNYLGDKTKGTRHDKDVFFTFISTLCINKNYFNESYNYLINNIGLLEGELQENAFNYSLVAVGNIKDCDKIGIINNPISVYCELDNCSWESSIKIPNDLRYLVNYILSNYKIGCHGLRYFRRLKLSRYLGFFLGKLGIYGIASKIYNYIRKD